MEQSLGDDCVNAQESIIWKYFGTYGTKETDWCVTDGPFDDNVRDGCIRREWRRDHTIPPWYCADMETLATLPPLAPILAQIILTIHFHPHLAIDGWNGNYSVKTATYE